jgi:hypothetical protein
MFICYLTGALDVVAQTNRYWRALYAHEPKRPMLKQLATNEWIGILRDTGASLAGPKLRYAGAFLAGPILFTALVTLAVRHLINVDSLEGLKNHW